LASRDVALSKAEVSRRSFLAGFLRDRRGVVGVALAVLLPVLVGFAGIGIEVGMWFWIQRQNQSAADAAAISAGLEYAAQIQSNVATNPSAAATIAAGYNLFSTSPPNTLTLYQCYGFTVDGSCNTSISNGAFNAVQVVLTQPLNTAFANFVTAIWGPNINTVTVRTTAIAAFPQTSNACLLALDPTAANAVLVDNNGTLPNPNCWVASNSSSASALSCNSCTIAGPTNVVGGDAVFNNGHLNGSPNRTYASAIADPYAGVSVAGFPAPGADCTWNPTVTHGSIPPGHYCGGIQVNGSSVTLSSSGVYYIDQPFSIQNGSLSATPPGGVTIIINGTYCIGDGTCQPGHGVGANSTLTIAAQPTGPFAGIAIFGPRHSNPAIIQEFAGGSNNNIQGAIYFPSQTIQFDPTAQLTSLCTQIIGDQIHIENDASVSSNCSGTGVTSISVLEVYLAS
jgi:Flp pilus assembly protein TadG